MELVQEAQNSKAPAQLLADRASQWLVLAAAVVGVLTFVAWLWWLAKPLLFAMTLMITVFVIACPDALGPRHAYGRDVGTGLGAMNGILFKNAAALDDATKLDVIVMDKTGTLTLGQPQVVDIVTAKGQAQERVLATAAIRSPARPGHPAARGRAYNPQAEGFREHRGHGCAGRDRRRDRVPLQSQAIAG